MTTLDIFEQLGAEPQFVAVYPEEYELRRLNQAEDGEVYKGKPMLSEINEFENETDRFDESGMVIYETVYNIKLGLVDDEKGLVLDIPIKLKTDETIQKNIHPSSTLNKLVKGIVRMNGGEMGDCNTFKAVNLDNIRNIVENTPLMKVKVEEVSGGSFLYNSFAIVNPSKDYDGEALVE